MTKKLTFKKAKSLALREVEAHPDFVYQPPPGDSCAYVHHTVHGQPVSVNPAFFDVSQKTPGCIVGRVLINFGLPIEKVAEFDVNGDNDGTGIVDIVESGALLNAGVSITPKALIFLTALQNKQDARINWRDAYLAGIDAVPAIAE